MAQFLGSTSRERDREQRLGWRVLRKSVADLHRRAEVCQAANDRYLEALSSVHVATPLQNLAATLCRPVLRHGRHFRALNPGSPTDGALLEVISRGEWTINGFRDRDLRHHLYPATAPALRKQQAGKVTRLLALLRAHGLIKKVSGTHRYLLTSQGRQIITALLAARQATPSQLTKLAA